MAKFELSMSGLQSFAGNLLVNMMTDFCEKLKEKGEKGDILEVFNLKREGDADLSVDVVVTFNGVEVPFDAYVESLEKNLGRMVTARAIHLVKERMVVPAGWPHRRPVARDSIRQGSLYSDRRNVRRSLSVPSPPAW